jgi:ribosome-binding protein aMBF1 (putative translation factor)
MVRSFRAEKRFLDSPFWPIPYWNVRLGVMKRKVRPEKTIYAKEYQLLLRLMRDARDKSGVTQVELAESLGQSQSFVSKIERGERRLDVLQLRTILAICGVKLTDFVERFERELAKT